MRSTSFLPLLSLLFPCLVACSAADGDFSVPAQEDSDVAAYAYSGYTPTPSLVLQGASPRLEAASHDRVRSVFSTHADPIACGALHVVDSLAGTAKTVTSDGFCSQYADGVVAADSTAERIAYWTWSDVDQGFRLMLWKDGAAPVVVDTHPGEQHTNELGWLHFGASHLLYTVLGPNQTYSVKAYDTTTGAHSTLSTNAALVAPVFDAARGKLLLREDGMGERDFRLHDLSTGSSVLVATGVEWEQQVSPDGRFVAVVSQCLFGEGLCRLTVLDFETLDVFEPGEGVTKVAGFAVDGALLAYVASGKLHLWDLAAGTVDQVPGDGVCWAGTAPAAERVAFVAECGGAPDLEGSLRVVDAYVPGQPRTLGQGVAASDARLMMSADGNRFAALRTKAQGGSWLDLWSLATGKKETAGVGYGAVTRTVESFGFSSDGTKVLYERASGWVGPCPPYGICGYRELRSFDFTRSMLQDQNVAGSAVASVDAEGSLRHGWGPVTFPLRSPNREHMAYTAHAGTVLGAVYALDTDSLRNRKVLGSWTPLLVTDQHMILTRNATGGSFTGLYRVSLQ
jgi:hypothetical protein